MDKTTSTVRKWKSQGSLRPPGTPSADYKVRPHPTASHGVFISKNAIDLVKGDDLKKFRFTTRQNIEYVKKNLTNEERGQNSLAIYEADSLWQNYKFKEAPNFDKSNCSYGVEFPAKPSIDYVDNKALSQIFRGPGTQQKPPDLCKSGPRTQYEAFHTGAFGEDLKKYKMGPNGPKGVEGDVLGGVGGMLETTLTSHKQFQPWKIKDCKQVLPEDAIHTKPKEHMVREHGQRTRYKLDYGPEATPEVPPAQPIRAARVNSIGQVGGPPYQRLEHMAKVQADYLIATRSSCRGFGEDPRSVDATARATTNGWLQGSKSKKKTSGSTRDPFRATC